MIDFNIVIEQAIFLALGVAVGVSQQTLGVGGGFLLVPLLPFALSKDSGLSQIEVVASSLMLSLSVAILNVFKSRSDLTKESSALGLRLGIVAGIASYWAADHADQLSDLVLSSLFILVVSGLGVASLLPERVRREPKFNDRRIGVSWASRIRDTLFSLASGALSALSGISGGIFFTPYLLRFSVLKDHQVIPVSIVALTLTLTGSVLRYSVSDFDLPWIDLPGFFIGAAMGAEVGKRVTHRIPRAARARFLGLILIGIALYSAFRQFGDKLH